MTAPYHIKIAPIAVRQIKALSAKHRKIVVRLIEALAMNPRPPGARKVEGMTGLYTETAEPDHLRLIYKIEEQEIFLLLVKQ